MSLAPLFPGQGAQFVGMSANLPRRGDAESMFAAASKLLAADLWKLTREGPEETLNSTAVSQPAIFVVSCIVLRALERAEGLLPWIGTAGLSLGEYTALVCAGSLRFEDALAIVIRRGAYMQEACDRCPSGMTSILGLNLETVEDVVAEAARSDVLSVANINADDQIVISGEHPALERAAVIADKRGARRTVPLKVAGAYHSPLMASATLRLRPFLERVEIAPPRIPFYANVSGARTVDPEAIREGLIRQIESPVRWAPTLRALREAGMCSVVEPGPGRVVAGLVKQVDRRMPVHSVLTAESVEKFLSERQEERGG